HYVYVSIPVARAVEYDFPIGRPCRITITSSVVSQSPLVTTVSIHHVNLRVSVSHAGECYALAVSRPCWFTINSRRIGDLCHRASVSIHYINVMLTGAIARKSNLAAVGRPCRLEIVSRIIRELGQLSINAHYIYFIVPVPV